jgi:hypothetical protein
MIQYKQLFCRAVGAMIALEEPARWALRDQEHIEGPIVWMIYRLDHALNDPNAASPNTEYGRPSALDAPKSFVSIQFHSSVLNGVSCRRRDLT